METKVRRRVIGSGHAHDGGSGEHAAVGPDGLRGDDGRGWGGHAGGGPGGRGGDGGRGGGGHGGGGPGGREGQGGPSRRRGGGGGPGGDLPAPDRGRAVPARPDVERAVAGTRHGDAR